MYEEERTESLLEIESNSNKKRNLIIFILICALLVIGLAGGFGWYFYRVNLVSGNLEKGNSLLNDKKYQEAVKIFDEVLKIDGNNLDAYIGTANAYSGSGDFDKAKTYFEDAIKLNTDTEELMHIFDAYIAGAINNKISQENLFSLLDQAFEKTGSSVYSEKKSEYEAKIPSFSLNPGSYQAKQTLQINKGNDNDKIYYTTDGSDPTSSSKEYNAAIELNIGKTTVKAIEIGQDGFAGKVVQGEYSVQEVAASTVQLQGTTTSSGSSSIRSFSARASSTLPDMGGINYSPSNVLDQSDNTAWVEGVSGDGIGEYIELVYNGSQPITINGFLIKNGYLKSVKAFNENGSPSELEVLVNDVSKFSCKLERSRSEQKFSVNPLSLSNGDTIRFVIRNVVAGSDDGVHDTAISEIIVF
ncbi:chitobiase/beta-hexosaminidase C-terminal domain-containing protein [Acetobacterium sp.]|uniref:NADase-type glycan-binding domain-containing protein n=1 Tax=Acetobacterium sp. TaxID=1872094 RepID=UPI0035936DBD